jgi:hypothetical protein
VNGQLTMANREGSRVPCPGVHAGDREGLYILRLRSQKALPSRPRQTFEAHHRRAGERLRRSVGRALRMSGFFLGLPLKILDTLSGVLSEPCFFGRVKGCSSPVISVDVRGKYFRIP